MRIGITGHQDLTKRLQIEGANHSSEEAWAWVEHAFIAMLADMDLAGVMIVSCLAVGADQHLSRIGLERGARLSVVIPSVGFENTYTEPETREAFEKMLSIATEVVYLNFPEPSEPAFYAGGKCVVDQSDMVVAVWDGRDAVGLGGTGDIVAYSLDHGHDVHHLDPIHRSIHRLSGKE